MFGKTFVRLNRFVRSFDTECPFVWIISSVRFPFSFCSSRVREIDMEYGNFRPFIFRMIFKLVFLCFSDV